MQGHKLKKSRQVSQVFFFSLFIFLIYAAGTSGPGVPDSLFFYFSPLLSMVVLGASRLLVSGLLVGFVFLFLTLIFGRFFCGWMCPLGVLIDVSDFVIRKPLVEFMRPEQEYRFHKLKIGILIFLLTASVFSFQFLYFFDPIVISTRFFSIFLPHSSWDSGNPAVYFDTSAQHVLFLGLILGLSAFSKRFWCRYLCPLGALYGLTARFSILKIKTVECPGCSKCLGICPTDAIDKESEFLCVEEECIRCFDCLDWCPTGGRMYQFGRDKNQRQPEMNMSRRSFIGAGAAGIVSASILPRSQALKPTNKIIIRPPHSYDERMFLQTCVRCEACVGVCPTHGLQPLFLENGFSAIWTPALRSSIGPCKLDCARCSEVCPTSAIGTFDERSKYTLKMGTAQIVRNYCIPYSENRKCGKCIPACPTGAIGYALENGIEKPVKIDYLLCVGCGICEFVCNRLTAGSPGIIMTNKGRNTPTGVDPETIDFNRTY